MVFRKKKAKKAVKPKAKAEATEPIAVPEPTSEMADGCEIRSVVDDPVLTETRPAEPKEPAEAVSGGGETVVETVVVTPEPPLKLNKHGKTPEQVENDNQAAAAFMACGRM